MNTYNNWLQPIENLNVIFRVLSRRKFNKFSVFLAGVVTIALLVGISDGLAQQVLPVRVDRWLEIQQVSGTVNAVIGGNSQPARVAARLQNVGDSITTGSASSAVLAVDTAIGLIDVSENTSVRIKDLTVLANGGQITHLEVARGQVRLELRPFTNPDSELEIETPAGISGVRGTTFGVSVQPTGQTGVATIEGSVVAAAQGQQVAVGAGLQSLIVPGEPPTPPEPLRDNPQLDIRVLQRMRQGMLQIAGQTDPVNLLIINDEPQSLTEIGTFDLQVALPDDRRIAATVITPLGTRQLYELAVP